MHIPENYLSPATCAVTGAAMVPVWAHSVKKVKDNVPKEKLPLIGVGAAFSFLAMMFNVPLVGGTTGHAVGGTLIALLFGPDAACLAVSVALIIQAFIFGDGGIMSLGANCFNMAFLLPYVGYFVYNLIVKKASKGNVENASTGIRLVAAGVGSYIGLAVAALSTSIMFGIQPYIAKDASGNPLYCPYDLTVSIPAMMIPHLAVACFVEAIFTIAVFAFVKKTSPTLITDKFTEEEHKKSRIPLFALAAVLIVATPLGLLATGDAWGEWEIEGWTFPSPLPDYSLEGAGEVIGYILSAILGAALLVIIFKLISLLFKDKKNVA